MTQTPGELFGAAQDESLIPLLVKLEATFQGQPIGFVQKAVDAAVRSLLDVLPPWARSATVQVQGASMRYTFDGTQPAASIGHRADANTVLTITGVETLRGFQWTQETATGGAVAVTFWS